MSAESIPVQALVEHREFVRSLARRLVGDEHAADDLVQDATVAALRARAAASPIEAPRAWLARIVARRAMNERRERARRAARESVVARAEATSDADLASRVELEHRVVRAVLALREPYKSVVLGRYYEDRSTKELAARQGVAESSVRSQEARALEMLRKELDREFDGGRAAWSALLLPLAGRDEVVVPALVKTGAIGVGVASVAAIALVVARATRVEETATLVAATSASAPVDLAPAGAALPPATELARPDEERSPAARARASSGEPRMAELAALDTPALLVLAQQVQRELVDELLTPDPELAAAFPTSATRGVARILERTRFGDFAPVDVLGIRGGGAYFSFVTRSSSYDDAPTLGLEQGSFKAGGFYGNATGGLVDLGDVALDGVPRSADRLPPSALRNERLDEQWALLWSDARTTEQSYREGLREDLQRLGIAGRSPAIVGHTYVSRFVSPGELDVLTAFRSLAADENGHTIAYRVLWTWSLDGTTSSSSSSAPAPVVPESPAWLRDLELDALLALQTRLRAIGAERLFAVPDAVPSDLRAVADRTGGGIARLLNPGRYDALVGLHGGGAHVSFVAMNRSLDYDTHLALSNGSFACSFWGGQQCAVLDVGDVDLLDLDPEGRRVPDGLSERGVRAWRFLWDLRAPVGGPRNERVVPTEARTTAMELGLDRPRAIAGHTYVLRHLDTEPAKPDFVVAFRDALADADGHTIVWRMLKTFPVELAEPK